VHVKVPIRGYLVSIAKTAGRECPGIIEDAIVNGALHETNYKHVNSGATCDNSDINQIADCSA
jgi:hypothetical protein